jgi:hypothetical protein
MTKRELIEMFIGLSYNTGYEQARKDIEKAERFEKELKWAYQKGKAAEAARQGDLRRAADVVGGAE